MPSSSAHIQRRSAFTLTELVAVISVVGVIAAAAAAIIYRAVAANSQITLRGSLYAEASAAMDRIVRRVQRTSARTGSDPAEASIASFTPTAIAWDDGSAVRFDAPSGTLSLRDTTAGDSPAELPSLAGNVASFTLTPCGDTGADLFTSLGTQSLSASQSGGVQRVSIALTLTRDGQSVTLRTRAFLRCRMAKAVAQ